MTLPELAIRRHVTMLMILVSIVVLGGISLTRLPLAFMPDFEEPEVMVRVRYPGSAPEQVEYMITRPIEDAMGSLEGLKLIWSRSEDWGSIIRLEFEWGSNIHLAKVEIWEKLDRIRGDLPEDIQEISVMDDWDDKDAEDPILEGRLSFKDTPKNAYAIVERRVVRPLQRVPGVAQVKLEGITPREVRVNLHLAALDAHNISIRDVRRLIDANNFDQSLGKLTDSEQVYQLRMIGAYDDVEDIRELALREDGLRLRDIAEVTYQEREHREARHLNRKKAIGISISAEPKANVPEVCEAVQARILELTRAPELQDLLEKDGFMIWMDRGAEIRRTLKDLLMSGVYGALLASIVLYIFLRRFSTTLISVLCIPFSLIVTCAFMWIQDTTLNTLSLLGLIVGIGMLVDNAVVVIESIFRYQEMGYDSKESSRIGASDVSMAVIAATLTSVITFLPLIFNKSSELNIFLSEIGITICITLLASLFISQTLIPLATSWLIKARARKKQAWIIWLEKRYVRLLKFNLRNRWLTPLILLAMGLSTYYPWSTVDMDFGHSRIASYAEVRYDYSESASMEAREKLITEVEELLWPHREELLCKNLYSYWSNHHTMTRVYLKDGMVNEANIEKVRDRIEKLLPEYPGIEFKLAEPRVSYRRGDSRRLVGVQVTGEDVEVIKVWAEKMRDRFRGIDGLEHSWSTHEREHTELHLEFNREAAANYGVSSSAVAETVGLTFRGRNLSRFRTPYGEREMRMTLDEKEEESISQLQQLPIVSSGNRKVPIAAVADVNRRRGRHRIEREDRLTSIWVGAHYEKGKTAEDYHEAIEVALADIVLPPGYSWNFHKDSQKKQERYWEFAESLILALILIFAVMAGLFESVQRAIALMIALPFALSGAWWTLYLTGTDFDRPASVGLLLLIGIVVNNGIVLIEHINSYQRKGSSRQAAMLRGGRERLRPILMTALTTVLGLLPIIIQRPALGGTYYYSMALVIIGGITISTFLTSILLPTTVTIIEDLPGWIRGLFSRTLRLSSGSRPTKDAA
jgi:HAE1 family hydrophobic/amphiphilic exporter-1